MESFLEWNNFLCLHIDKVTGKDNKIGMLFISLLYQSVDKLTIAKISTDMYVGQLQDTVAIESFG